MSEEGVCGDYTGEYLTRSWNYYISYLKRFSNNPKTILDIGCGTGLFLECCQHHDIRVCGVEYSEKGLESCLQKGFDVVKHNLIHNLSFLEDATFDAIFCFQVIEHLTYQAQINTIKESYRMLKPGGQLQIDSPCRHYLAQHVPTHISLLTPKELKAMAEDAGFTTIDMSYNYPQSHNDIPAGLLKYIWEQYQPDFLSQTATILAVK